MKINKDKLINICLVTYIISLLLILILKLTTPIFDQLMSYFTTGRTLPYIPMQLEPFKTIKIYGSLARRYDDWFVKNLAGNVLIFVPWGILVPLKYKWERWLCLRTFVSGVLLSVGIELLQYVLRVGFCDVDDLMLNTLGVVFGIVVYAVMRSCIRRNNKRRFPQ